MRNKETFLKKFKTGVKKISETFFYKMLFA